MVRQLEGTIHEEKEAIIRKLGYFSPQKLKSDLTISKYLIIEVYNSNLRKRPVKYFKKCYLEILADIKVLDLCCFLETTKTIFSLLIEEKIEDIDAQYLFNYMKENIEEILDKLP